MATTALWAARNGFLALQWRADRLRADDTQIHALIDAMTGIVRNGLTPTLPNGHGWTTAAEFVCGDSRTPTPVREPGGEPIGLRLPVEWGEGLFQGRGRGRIGREDRKP